MTVEAVTFGTNHVFARSSRWADLLYKFRLERYLPARFRKNLHRSFTHSEQTPEETLIIWYSVFQTRIGSYVNTNPPEECDVIDEHGCSFPVDQHRGNRPTSGFHLYQAHVRVFPRRQKSFKVRAKFPGNPPVEWTIQNPAARSYEELKPEPLPARRKVGGFEFVLDSVEHRAESGRNRFEPRFKVLQDDVDRTAWFKPVVSYLDATGNRGPALCPHEAAWKMELDFYRTREASFAEEEIWRISDLKAPASGEVIELNAGKQIAGLKIKPYALCGTGHFKFSNNVCLVSEPWDATWSGESSGSSVRSGWATVGNAQRKFRFVELEFRTRKLSLPVEIEGLQTPDRVLIRARNEKGETVWFRSTRSEDIYPFVTDKAFEAQKLELEFIAQKPIEVSFVVVPPRAAK